MVLSVCRAFLRDPHDAEDAFQATFLVLVRNGGAIRRRDAMAGWLHGVAHRVAIQANSALARRRRLEREVAEMAVATSTYGPAAGDDLLPALHEEIARLPEKLRLAVVHCDLEGMTQAQAAAQLHWSRRTLQLRLAEGRARLKRRLARRGLAPSSATLGVILLREARAAVPQAWSEATVRAALATVNRAVTVGAVSAVAQQWGQEVFKVMLLRKLAWVSVTLMAAGLIGWGASAAFLSLGEQAPKGGAGARRPRRGGAVPAQGGDHRSAGGSGLRSCGRHISGSRPCARPRRQARRRRLGLRAPLCRRSLESDRHDGRAAEGARGRDRRRRAVLFRARETRERWRLLQQPDRLAQRSDRRRRAGFAPAWVEAGDMVKRGETALRLVRDDVPVRGRVLDSQGRPVAGVTVRIRAIWEVNGGIDLDAMLDSGAVPENMLQIARLYGKVLGEAAPAWQADPAPLWPGGRNAWTSGADGRFEVQGIGRDRIARLEFHGGGVADGTLDVMARPAKGSPKTRPLPSKRRDMGINDREAAFLGLYPQGTQLVGATFDFIAGPTKPIAGVIRLKGSGKTVEGAIVHAADPGTHTAVTARTDASGRFRLDGVPKGEYYQIQVNPRQGIDPFLRLWEIIDDTEGLKPIETAIEVPPGVIVTGRLIDKVTGRVVPPADVEYTKAPDNPATGDALAFSRLADGAFGLTVSPGRGMIAGAAAALGKDDPFIAAHLKAGDRSQKGIEARLYPHKLVGHHTYRFIDVPAGSGPLAVDLELTRGASRAVRLTGPDGLPVVGALAYGSSARDWSGTERSRRIDAATFEVGGLEPGHPRLLVFTHKARKLVGAAVLKDEDLKSTAPLEVKLVPAGVITGRLLDEDGLPWAGATFHVWMTDPDRPPSLGFGCAFGERVTADAQGRFRVEAFVPGVETEVMISVPNRLGVRLDAGNALRKPALKPGEVRDLGDVKAKEIHQQ